MSYTVHIHELHCTSEYKITVGHRPISGQLTKLTAQNVTWSVFTSEQVSALSLLPRETDRSFMGGVWICAKEYTKHVVLSQWCGFANYNYRDRSTCHGGKVGRSKYVSWWQGRECNVCLAIARVVMKRALSSSAEASTSEAKKRKVTYTIYQKWKSELDRDCQTVSWLDCESKVVAGKRIVSKLRCSTCAKFKVKIASRRNFSDRWIVGAD